MTSSARPYGQKMKWFYMAGPGGTIAIKAEYASKAKRKAAERWGCGADEIRVTGEETYDVTGVPSSTK